MTSKKLQAKIFILSAPSRGGKDALVRGLKQYARQLRLKHVVGYTTRKQRTHEKNGQVYHFVDRKQFQSMAEKGDFIEWVIHNHEYYGIPKNGISGILEKGYNALLQINLKGAEKIKTMWTDRTVTLFLRPEKLSDIRKRFDLRDFTKKQIQERMAIAKNEIALAKTCDYIIVNRDGALQETLGETVRVIKQELGIISASSLK